MILIGGRNYRKVFLRYKQGLQYISTECFINNQFKLMSVGPVIFMASPALMAQKYNHAIHEMSPLDVPLSKLTGRDIILISSAAVYGLSSKRLPFTEGCQLLGSSLYAKEKIKLEYKLSKIGQNVCILRPSGFYGGCEGYNPSNFLNNLKNAINLGEERKFIIDFNGKQIRDFTLVNDFVDLIYFLSQALPTGLSIFNYSSTKPIYFEEILKFINVNYKKIAFELRGDPSEQIHSSLDTQMVASLWQDYSERNIFEFLSL